MAIKVCDLKEGFIISSIVVGERVMPPSVCTKIRHEKDGTVSFRIENKYGSFWKNYLNPTDSIDAAGVRKFLDRF